MKDDAKPDLCGGCKWWERLKVQQGICRRFLPNVIVMPAQTVRSDWPETLSDEWCGEFAPRPNPVGGV